MADQNLTDEQMMMRYPPDIVKWEMKHGIVKYDEHDMTYVALAKPIDEVFDSIEREKAERRRNEYIAARRANK